MITKTAQIFNTNCPYDNISQTKATRVLFVCSVGMLRSPTAQMVASGIGLNARACGVDVNVALIPISCNLIDWAQHIVFMTTSNYKDALIIFKPIDDYHDQIKAKSQVWNIPDNYNWGDNVLWSILHEKMKVFNELPNI
jgi:predicted protein tyrosine phosphatase